MERSRQRRQLQRGVAQLRQQFAQCAGSVFGSALPEAEIRQVVEEEAGTYRDRIYPPIETLRLFVGQILSDDRACQEVAGRRLSERVAKGESPCSLNTGPYCKARQRLPLQIPVRLARGLGRRLEAKIPKAWRWRGRSVKLFDGTTVSMPDTPDNQKRFPQSSEQKPGLGFPLARIGALIGLSSGAVLGHAVAACAGKGSGEQTLMRTLLPLIEAGDIVLADALLANWCLIADIKVRGGDVVMSQHGSRRTDFALGTLLGAKDHVVDWPRPKRPSWMSMDDYRRYPQTLRVREVEIAGRVLVTTMLDPGDAPAEALNALYSLRWAIEVDFRTIKAGLEMDVLRCQSSTMIEKEIAVYLLAYNLVRWTIASAAALAHVLPRTLSFIGAKRILLAFTDQLRRSPGKRVSVMLAVVLAGIASLRLPYRPGRIEPRAKKRRPKPLPLLTQPRHLARQKIRDKRAVVEIKVAA